MKKIFLFITLFSFFTAISQDESNRIFNNSRTYDRASGASIEINYWGDTTMIYEFKLFQINGGDFPLLDYTKTYKNTPFYNNRWYNSQIFTEDGEKVKGLIAFNTQSNFLLFKKSPDEKPTEIKPNEFTLNGKTFRKYKDVYGQAGDIYYEALVKGEIQIFKQYYCSLNTNSYNGNQSNHNGYDGEFNKESRYFTIYANKMTRIGNNYKVFGLFASQAKAYAKKENLKLTRESDLVKIATYLNELYSKVDVALN
jgi:hypothetical protein